MNITLSPLRHYTTVQQYQIFAKKFLDFKDEAEKVKLNRLLCRTDLFWLLWHGCGKHHVAKQWILDRCKEVEVDFRNTLDIWAREHYKSSLLTYGKSIQNILASHGEDPLPEWDRETTIGIISVTRPLAKGFLREIKQTFEDNALLKSLFPDILYQFPKSQSPKWALDINTPVLTSKGWKAHGDLEIGDKIYGANGTLINVIGTSGTMHDHRCYRVKLGDCEIIASEEHLWPVECKKGTSWENSEIKILKTIELRARTKKMRLLPTPVVNMQHYKEQRISKHRYVVSVEPVESAPVNCIKVDAKDSLYLAGLNLIPTHNSEDEGICVKRKSVYKEQTVEAWGLVDGQPTGKHFYELAYDDIVTQDSVTTPEMIQKTTAAFGLSDNIGTRGGIYRIVGTFYHSNDTLNAIIDTGVYKLRKYPATIDGKWPIDSDLEAFLLTKAELELKYIKQGPYIYSCQLLLNPVASSLQNFKFEWLKYYGGWDKSRMMGNFYIICDPANSKKKTSDYTVFIVVAACSDNNIYIVDMVRDRLNLAERTNALFSLVKIWRPLLVGYEQYGMQSDIEHIREKMEQLNYRFNIAELGGKTAKNDRISKIIPDFKNAKIYLPFVIEKKNYEGKSENLVDIFVKEEYLVFPTPKHDDMLDCLARIKDEDLCVTFPLEPEYEDDNSNEQFHDTTRNKATGY